MARILLIDDGEGIETIIALRRMRPRLPIIVMSGGTPGSPLYLRLSVRLGAMCQLAKPFTPALLLCTVEKVLAETRAGSPAP